MQKNLIAISLLAAIISLGAFAYVTDAPAYAGTAPETCANCHVMDSAYENWFHAPHARVTTCVDCHLPHDNLVNYWVEKGRTGMHDVYMFTTGQIPDAIRAKPGTKKIIQENCIHCHETTVETVMMGSQSFDRYCWECHRDVAHGTRGITASPFQDTVNYKAAQP